MAPPFSLLISPRLVLAYRLYLKFPHAFLTILASQVITFLAVLVLVMPRKA